MLEEVTIADRLRLAEHIYVAYPRTNEILAKIRHCHQHSMIAAEPESMLIIGDTGAGKTTLHHRYEQSYPRVETEERTIVPVLNASIPVPATPKSLVVKLLHKLGDPLAGSGTTVGQTLRLYKLMQACGVELIILDEFQHFIDRDSNKVMQTISDWLKELLNETRVPVVLSGMPHCERILETNAQLRRRFSVRERLAPFGWEHADPATQKSMRDDLRRFLKALDQQLPLAERSHLADPTTAYLIYCATKGRVATIVKLVRRAVEIALNQGSERLSMEVLAAAYEDRIAEDQPDEANPFAGR